MTNTIILYVIATGDEWQVSDGPSGKRGISVDYDHETWPYLTDVLFDVLKNGHLSDGRSVAFNLDGVQDYD